MFSLPNYSYVASPYSHPDKWMEHERYLAVMKFVAQRMKDADEYLYSPILHCHEMARNYALPGDALFWQKFNQAMQGRAEKTIVLMLNGWEQSKGVQYEITFANMLEQPIEYV